MNIVAELWKCERCKRVMQAACSCISRGAMLALRIFARYWWTMKAWYARLAARCSCRVREQRASATKAGRRRRERGRATSVKYSEVKLDRSKRVSQYDQYVQPPYFSQLVACFASSCVCVRAGRRKRAPNATDAHMSKRAKTALSGVAINKERYLELLGKLVGESETLQNDPPNGLIPKEDNASQHVLAALQAHTVENGGPLTVERVAFTPGRGNVIITYPGETDESLAFVGSHMDLVPANPET